jgi:hypothetical protein
MKFVRSIVNTHTEGVLNVAINLVFCLFRPKLIYIFHDRFTFSVCLSILSVCGESFLKNDNKEKRQRM